jgi:hypothetical protein
VVLPFAKYKRDEALRIKSDEVGFLTNRHQRWLHTTASYPSARRLHTAEGLSSYLSHQSAKLAGHESTYCPDAMTPS